jgi:hypothetical protein
LNGFPSKYFLICCFLGLGLSLPLGGPASVLALDDKPSPEQANAAQMDMNGYTLKQFGDFVHDWHFVTIRYRRDSGEMRFVYANGIAWKALNAHSKDYPDGAVFAKVAVTTQEDAAFVDSSVPSGSKRIQFMVRDHQRHEDTDGWGYELFNPAGHALIPTKLKDVVDACNACHLVVPERGMVFSEPMAPLLGAAASVPESPKSKAVVSFVTVDVSTLPDFVRARMPPEFKQARQMQGPITQHVFSGTVYEAMPLVAAEAARTNMPAVLFGQNGTPEFSLLWPVEGEKAECTLPGGQNGRSVAGGLTMARVSAPAGDLYRYRPIPSFCASASMASHKDE